LILGIVVQIVGGHHPMPTNQGLFTVGKREHPETHTRKRAVELD